MIVTSNLAGPGSHPFVQPSHLTVCSVDVEWTKNYRVKNGNRPFCYSAVWLAVPINECLIGPENEPFFYTSAYVESERETQQLVLSASADLATALDHADVIVGHQLCTDLSVLAANCPSDGQPIETARRCWRARAGVDPRQFVDTRFDTDAILEGPSRRLVDVCSELGLDVTQPELARQSMTAMQCDWLDHCNHEARERISVLNLRHSLSAALVALRLQDRLRWTAPFNVNRLLDRQLSGVFEWIAHPVFRDLL